MLNFTKRMPEILYGIAALELWTLNSNFARKYTGFHVRDYLPERAKGRGY